MTRTSWPAEPTGAPASDVATRVALVVATAGATGVESHLLALTAGMSGLPCDPVLFVPRDGPLTERARTLGVAIEHGAPAGKLDLGAVSRLAARFRGRFDVVHAHGPRATFWTLPAARRAGVGATVATVHELRWRTLPPSWRKTAWVSLEQRSLDRADRLIAVSDHVRTELLARRPDWAARVRVVHGTSLLLALPAPVAAPRADQALRLVTVGRLEQVKGHDRVLEALAWLTRAGVNATLDVLGEGTLAVRLRARAEELGVGPRVSWRHDRDVIDVLDGHDVFVSGTHEETLGLAALEALSRGLPVVAPAVGGLREVVEEGTGVLVDPSPASEIATRLAGALKELAADPARCRRMGETAARTVRERHAPRAMAAATLAVYREALVDPVLAPPRPASTRGS